ncbi:hypothetical protein BDA99DRAFT_522191 [Phascolomyces articulosus]|uniref:DUF7905 domain-containing protein n=1 Tax=Phascolomyces articulosus TaxID=60185 RepID=A0AAD5JRB2_9FUNG|nr:hypothetical protein BDA99DRAFT_522191 [Phascolomyces articulosus]
MSIPFTSRLYFTFLNLFRTLAEQTRTTITFDFNDQYFDITGRSAEGVEKAAQHIYNGLLQKLNRAIDEDMMLGTFATLASMEEAATRKLLDFASEEPESPETGFMNSSQNQQQQQQNQQKQVHAGRPLELEEFDDMKSTLNEIEFKIMKETEEKEDETHKAVFKFSKNIANPQEVLRGPPGPNLQATDNLKEVMRATETECYLEGREIHIEGSEKDQVEDALQRFLNIQTLYKRGRRPVTIVPCVHYPTDSPYYGLYFCNLNRYAQNKYVDLLYSDSLRPMHVLLPVFKNPETGQYQKPKDLLDAAPRSAPVPGPAQERIPAPPRPSWVQHPSAPMQSTLQHQQRQQPPRRQSMPSHGHVMQNTPTSMTSSEMPLWGENREFVNNYAASSYASSPSPTTPSPSYQTNFQQQYPQQPESHENEFPALPSAPPRKSYVPVRETPGQPMQRRVIRLTNQQHVPGSPDAPLSQLEMARQYNLNNIRTALTDGLESVRGFKGEIRLEAKLGKVLWTNLSSEIAKKIWEFQDIKDLVVKEHGVKPLFNNVTTAEERIMSTISEILPRPFKHTGFFEIHCQARNQPALEYKPVVMIMNQGIVELKKVITRQQKVTEIDWVSLDRKFDFQLSLSAQELCRVDVKPYSTFIKKVSVCPITNQMTFENVRDFLKVDHILHKQKTFYRIHFPFIVEITRVESVPIRNQPNSGYGVDKVLGVTGEGHVWYDLQVFYTNHDEPFRTNLSLSAGELASWTVDDILGPENDPQKLIEYIKCLLVLTEKCEPLFT